MSMPGVGLLGGPSTHLPLLRDGLIAKGVEVIPVSFMRRSENESTARKLIDRSSDLLEIARLVILKRPDLLHHNSAFDGGTFARDGLLCLLGRVLRTPVFVKIHGSHRASFEELPAFKRLMRFLVLKFSSGLGVLSDQERDEFVSKWPSVRDKIFVVKNIVRSDFLNKSVKSSERKMVFFASRFMREKGVFDLLNAVPEILRSIPDCQFTFVGDGPDVEPFLDAVRVADLSENVTYLSNRTYIELIAMYAEGGIFLFPTHFPEGMPMALIEAMAVGLLTISAPVRFIRNIPILAVHGLVLSADTKSYSSQISKTVIRVLNDRVLRNAIGQSSKDLIREYSREEVSEEFISLYARLLAR